MKKSWEIEEIGGSVEYRQRKVDGKSNETMSAIRGGGGSGGMKEIGV